MSLNPEQLNALLAPLNPARVRQLQGNSHIEAWDARRWLLRIFGWGGWDFTVVSCDCISERSVWDEQNPLKGRHTVVYRVIGRLTIKDTDGNVLAVFEDAATGDGINQPSIADAHDFALKTAMSQALKRCAVNLGDQFGLSLYNKGSKTAVVGKSAAHSGTDTHDAREEVVGGDMDENRTAEDAGPTAAPTSSPAPVGDLPLVPAESDLGSPPEAEVVQSLRERVIDTMHLDRRAATVALAKLKAEIAKAKCAQVMVTNPGGHEVTLGGLVDQVLDLVTRAAAGAA